MTVRTDDLKVFSPVVIVIAVDMIDFEDTSTIVPTPVSYTHLCVSTFVRSRTEALNRSDAWELAHSGTVGSGRRCSFLSFLNIDRT